MNNQTDMSEIVIFKLQFVNKLLLLQKLLMMEIFYYELIKEGFISLPEEESKHISKVLRKSSGDRILVTDGHGNIFDAEIVESGRHCTVNATFQTLTKPDRNYHLHVAVAPTKMLDRFEWFIEKSMEIGIDEITPLLCEHSERKIIKIERLMNIAISAMKQSKNLYLPKINELTTFSDFINKDILGSKCIAHCENTDYNYYFDMVQQGFNTILIGPEGDFSKEEVNKSFEKGFIGVSLGNSILRVETAAVVACSMTAIKNYLFH